MLHADFAALLPSQKAHHISAAVQRLAFDARLVTFTSGASKTHTYATVELSAHRQGRDEFVTYLVCPQNLGPVLARTQRESGEVYFDSGHYGYDAEYPAVQAMYERANR